MLRALESRDYRIFFLGQSISLVGTWMQFVAMSWLVYRITGSATLLGGIFFSSQLPTFLLGPFAGVVADGWNRRRLLLVTQSLSLVQALLLALLVVGGIVQVWHIIALSALLGVVNAFDMPVRHAFMVGLVDRKEDLPNAIALYSSMVNSGRLVGPPVAALLIGPLGEAGCFFVNAASYAAVLLSLRALRDRGSLRSINLRKLHHELTDGMSYAWRFPPIRDLLLLLALVSLTGLPYAVLLPVFARDLLGAGVHTYGVLVAAPAVGAFLATLHLAARPSVLGLGKEIRTAVAAFGAALALFSISSNLPLSVLALVPAGYCSMTQIAATHTMLQTIVDEDKRGRVTSFFTMALIGANAFGSIVAGWLAQNSGPRGTVLTGGICCLVGAMIFSFRLPVLKSLVGPLYEKMGILPPGTVPRPPEDDLRPEPSDR